MAARWSTSSRRAAWSIPSGATRWNSSAARTSCRRAMETIELPDASAGFFGKVTSHGDFVSRRLPASFKLPWDEWLQHGMQGSRNSLGDAWLDTYLSSPIWRFALAPGVCDANSWAGIVMPSVDRVGRHFPLTIAAGVEGDVALLDWVENAASWYDRLEELALESLREDFSLDALDAAL